MRDRPDRKSIVFIFCKELFCSVFHQLDLSEQHFLTPRIDLVLHPSVRLIIRHYPHVQHMYAMYQTYNVQGSTVGVRRHEARSHPRS